MTEQDRNFEKIIEQLSEEKRTAMEAAGLDPDNPEDHARHRIERATSGYSSDSKDISTEEELGFKEDLDRIMRTSLTLEDFLTEVKQLPDQFQITLVNERGERFDYSKERLIDLAELLVSLYKRAKDEDFITYTGSENEFNQLHNLFARKIGITDTPVVENGQKLRTNLIGMFIASSRKYAESPKTS